MVETMKIIFIEHALERMRKRDIKKEVIIKVIKNPDNVVYGYGNRKVAQKLVDERLLRVIYEEQEEKIVVVTVYITSKVDKYLR